MADVRKSLESAYATSVLHHAVINTYADNEVTLSYFERGTNKEIIISLTIPAGTSKAVLLDKTLMRPDSTGDKAEFISCHIKAKKPVSVQYFSSGANSCGSDLALPVHAWGKKYVVATYNDNPGLGGTIGTPELASGMFMIIGAYNGTKVRITPTAKTTGGFIGVNQGPGATGTPQPYTVEDRREGLYNFCGSQRSIESGTLYDRVAFDRLVPVYDQFDHAYPSLHYLSRRFACIRCLL